MGEAGCQLEAASVCQKPFECSVPDYRSLFWNGQSVAISSATGFLLPRLALGARFERCQHFIDSIEYGGNATFADVLQPFGQLRVNDGSLRRGVFVVRGRQLWDDGHHTSASLEFQYLANFKSRLLPHGVRYGDGFAFHGDGHRGWNLTLCGQHSRRTEGVRVA